MKIMSIGFGGRQSKLIENASTTISQTGPKRCTDGSSDGLGMSAGAMMVDGLRVYCGGNRRLGRDMEVEAKVDGNRDPSKDGKTLFVDLLKTQWARKNGNSLLQTVKNGRNWKMPLSDLLKLDESI